jgi:hypothetical protein
MQQQRLYTVRTAGGFTFNIPATSLAEAQQKSRDPALSSNIGRMMREAIQQVESVTPNRDPIHKIKYPVFGNEFFR